MLEFSPTGYNRLLHAIRTHGYQLISFDDILKARTTPAHHFLLRHDIDFSLDYAHEMAKREAALGIHATYFVMLRSPMYNLWSRHNHRLLREIVGMGHAIGLHFDAACPLSHEQTLAEWIRFEANTLSQLAHASVTAFSLHQPSAEIIAAKLEIPGLVNTYHPGQMEGFTYLSDSNRHWRGKDPLALMAAGEQNIHLLIHPMWWMNDNPTTEGCWDDVIRLNFSRMQEQLLATERAYGGERKLELHRVK